MPMKRKSCKESKVIEEFCNNLATLLGKKEFEKFKKKLKLLHSNEKKPESKTAFTQTDFDLHRHKALWTLEEEEALLQALHNSNYTTLKGIALVHQRSDDAIIYRIFKLKQEYPDKYDWLDIFEKFGINNNCNYFQDVLAQFENIKMEE